MGRRELEIFLVSASLPTNPVMPRTRMQVAATAWISSPPNQTQSTWPDIYRDVNPIWNQALYFTLEYSATFGTFPDNLIIRLDNVANGLPYYVGGAQLPLRNWIELAGDQATVPQYYVCRLDWGGYLYLYYRLGPYNRTGAALLPWCRAAWPLLHLSAIFLPDIDMFN